jgi:hypothetical protein
MNIITTEACDLSVSRICVRFDDKAELIPFFLDNETNQIVLLDFVDR